MDVIKVPKKEYPKMDLRNMRNRIAFLLECYDFHEKWMRHYAEKIYELKHQDESRLLDDGSKRCKELNLEIKEYSDFKF